MHYQSMFDRNPANNPSAKNRVIEVFGEGAVLVAPDEAIIRLGVISEGVELTETLNQNSAALTHVIQALRDLGIMKEQIQTDEYRIDLQYDFQDGQQQFRGYRVTNLIKVTVADVTKVGLVVDRAVQQGANTVSSIQFSLKDLASFYNQALVLAYREVQDKAMTLASAAGVSLNQIPFSITELTAQRQPPIPFETTAKIQSVSTPIEAGQLEVKAQIVAKFSY